MIRIMRKQNDIHYSWIIMTKHPRIVTSVLAVVMNHNANTNKKDIPSSCPFCITKLSLYTTRDSAIIDRTISLFGVKVPRS